MPDTPESSEPILRADRRKRAQVVVAVVLTALVGVAAVFLVRAVAGRMKQAGEDLAAAEDDPARGEARRRLDAARRDAARAVRVCAWVVGLSVVGMGAWFGVLAVRIARSGRFPPPGTAVIKDTRIRTGNEARPPALLAAVACAVGILGGIALVWQIRRLVSLVLPP